MFWKFNLATGSQLRIFIDSLLILRVSRLNCVNLVTFVLNISFTVFKTVEEIFVSTRFLYLNSTCPFLSPLIELLNKFSYDSDLSAVYSFDFDFSIRIQ